MDDVIRWDKFPTGGVQALWHPYILSGAVNLLQGDSTAGRSYFSHAIISALTTGQALPNAEPLPPCNLIIQNAENSFSDVIKPRLEHLSADFARIKSISEKQGRLSLLSSKIEEIITRYNAKLFCRPNPSLYEYVQAGECPRNSYLLGSGSGADWMRDSLYRTSY